MKTKLFSMRKFIYFNILIVAFGLFGFTIFKYVEFRHSNPPVNRCAKKKLINNENGLVSHWTFEIVNDDNILDVSGNGNTGRLNRAINLDFPFNVITNGFDINYILGRHEFVDGVKGKALSVNGREWFSGDNINAYNVDTFTVATWVWRENDIYSVPTIIAKGSWPWIDGWWLTIKPGGYGIDMGIAWSTGFTHIESGYKLPLREWHHVAVTMNNVENEVHFFIDGVAYGDVHKDVHKWIINRNHSLFIADFDGSGRWPWQGKLDEVRFYNKVLIEQDIFNIYMKEKNSMLSENENSLNIDDSNI